MKSRTTVPIEEFLHALTDKQVIGRRMTCTGDDDVAAAITPGFVVESSQDKLMKILETALIQQDILLREIFKMGDGVGMVDGFEMMSQQFAADDQPIFKHLLGLYEG